MFSPRIFSIQERNASLSLLTFAKLHHISQPRRRGQGVSNKKVNFDLFCCILQLLCFVTPFNARYATLIATRRERTPLSLKQISVRES